MKKQILLAMAMLASVATYAQHKVGSFTIQPKIGLNIASLTDEPSSDVRVGVAVGAEGEYQVSRKVGISFGAIYSMQGCKYDGVTVRLNYINVPVLANFYVAKNFALKVGLQPGFKTDYEYHANGSTLEGDRSGLHAKSLDLSIPLGLSYEFNHFVIDGRYNFGVTKAFDLGDDRNSVFQFTFGYKFDL